MPGQQFEETTGLTFAATQDSTFNPTTTMDLTGTLAAQRRWDQLLLSNGDTADKTFTFILYDGSINTQVFDVTVVAGTATEWCHR